MRRFTLLFLISLSFFAAGCNKTTIVEISEEKPAVVIDPGDTEKLFIKDLTGKKWDVTHAAKKYGMKPENFQFGLGPKAIRPIQNPQFFVPGDPGWPLTGDFLVIATRLFGDARAYPINILKSFEIVDEVFGDTAVAVAY